MNKSITFKLSEKNDLRLSDDKNIKLNSISITHIVANPKILSNS